MKKVFTFICLLLVIPTFIYSDSLDGSSTLHLSFSFSGVVIGTKTLDTLNNRFNIRIVDPKYNPLIVAGLMVIAGYSKEKYLDAEFDRIDFTLDLLGVISALYLNYHKNRELKNEKVFYNSNYSRPQYVNSSIGGRDAFGTDQISNLDKFQLRKPGAILNNYLYRLSSL